MFTCLSYQQIWMKHHIFNSIPRHSMGLVSLPTCTIKSAIHESPAPLGGPGAFTAGTARQPLGQGALCETGSGSKNWGTYCWWLKKISQTHQLWLAIYGIIIYKVFAPSQVVVWDSVDRQCVASEVNEKFHQISLRHSFWLACLKGWGGDSWLVNELCVIGGYRHEFSVEFWYFRFTQQPFWWPSWSLCLGCSGLLAPKEFLEFMIKCGFWYPWMIKYDEFSRSFNFGWWKKS